MIEFVTRQILEMVVYGYPLLVDYTIDAISNIADIQTLGFLPQFHFLLYSINARVVCSEH